MRTVNFNELNSYEHLNLILSKKTIGAPAPKVLSVDIPGGDGVIDYSEYFGKINYSNRVLRFEFSLITDPKTFLNQYTKILNLLNGRKMKISLSDDADYYYVGRVTVNEWESQKRVGKLVIDVDAEPYKYKKAITLVSLAAITGATVVSCKNGRKRTQPKISVSAEAKIKIARYSPEGATIFEYERAITSYNDDDLNFLFEEGENVLTITPISGSVNVTIEYQEGDL